MIQFFVGGEPGPKGSRTVGVRKNGTAFSRPASKRQKPWEDAVVAVATGTTTLPPPYAVELTFHRARPKKPAYHWPTRDDLDKLVRCTVDGLVKGGLLIDDRHVIQLNASERYAETGSPPGCTVLVRSIAAVR